MFGYKANNAISKRNTNVVPKKKENIFDRMTNRKKTPQISDPKVKKKQKIDNNQEYHYDDNLMGFSRSSKCPGVFSMYIRILKFDLIEKKGHTQQDESVVQISGVDHEGKSGRIFVDVTNKIFKETVTLEGYCIKLSCYFDTYDKRIRGYGEIIKMGRETDFKMESIIRSVNLSNIPAPKFSALSYSFFARVDGIDVVNKTVTFYDQGKTLLAKDLEMKKLGGLKLGDIYEIIDMRVQVDKEDYCFDISKSRINRLSSQLAAQKVNILKNTSLATISGMVAAISHGSCKMPNDRLFLQEEDEVFNSASGFDRWIRDNFPDTEKRGVTRLLVIDDGEQPIPIEIYVRSIHIGARGSISNPEEDIPGKINRYGIYRFTNLMVVRSFQRNICVETDLFGYELYNVSQEANMRYIANMDFVENGIERMYTDFIYGWNLALKELAEKGTPVIFFSLFKLKSYKSLNEENLLVRPKCSLISPKQNGCEREKGNTKYCCGNITFPREGVFYCELCNSYGHTEDGDDYLNVCDFSSELEFISIKRQPEDTIESATLNVLVKGDTGFELLKTENLVVGMDIDQEEMRYGLFRLESQSEKKVTILSVY